MPLLQDGGGAWDALGGAMDAVAVLDSACRVFAVLPNAKYDVLEPAGAAALSNAAALAAGHAGCGAASSPAAPREDADASRGLALFAGEVLVVAAAAALAGAAVANRRARPTAYAPAPLGDSGLELTEV